MVEISILMHQFMHQVPSVSNFYPSLPNKDSTIMGLVISLRFFLFFLRKPTKLHRGSNVAIAAGETRT